MDLSTLTGLIAFVGTASFVGFFKSQILSMWPWFNNQTAQIKSGIVLGFSVVSGLVSYEILQLVPSTFFQQLQPVYTVIFASVTAWIASQGYYALTKPDENATTSTP